MDLTEEVETMLDAYAQAATKHSSEHPTGSLPMPGRKSVSAALNTASSIATVVRSAHRELDRLRMDDTIFPDGRRRMMTELLADAEDKTKEKADQAASQAQVARALFVVDAFPQLTRTRELVARQDARMILDASPDPVTALARLALRQDDIGALVVTAWGADYLTSRGCDERQIREAQRAVIGMALNGARDQGADEERSAAARGVMAADSAEGLAGAAGQVAHTLLNSFARRYGITREGPPKPRDPRRPAAPTVLGEEVEAYQF
ncbi:hypothetical protein LHJ74_20385 [Streptomyces sp. N2-109]|uniref:DUF222 domain-containing protein n=1 Tax=Streptomyces gossypii TaxID=2883101 RepID=A0ABT2JWK8_9ACTN|nr:hypothetical protein [Streptomyces gossypii]MCT2592231.1 hypothetical protein [Streptomyces gossypii]